MANPTPYERAYSFAGFQSTSPQTPLPGQKVDEELDNLERTTAETIAALGDIRRSDGKLKNGVVTADSLSSEIATGVPPAVLWLPSTQYETGASVFFDTGFYRALVTHVSGADFAVDLAAGKWVLFADFSVIVSDAEAARDDAEAAAATATTQAGIATTQAGTATTQAGISTTKAGEAAASASSASTSAGTATTQASTATTQAGISTTKAGEAAASAAAALASEIAAEAAAATVVNGFKVTQRFSAADGNLSAGQTSFTVPAYDAPYGYVYRNGAKLVNGVDVTFPTSTTFLLASAVAGSDVLEFEGFGVFNVANLAASQVAYSNTTSGIPAVTAQSAIDNLDGRVDTLEAGSSSLVLIAAKTASSSAQIDFTTELTDTYDEYLLKITDFAPATDDSELQLLIGTGGGPTYQTSSYTWGADKVASGGTAPWGSGVASAGSGVTSRIPLSPPAASEGVGNAAGETIRGDVLFSNPEATKYHRFAFKMGFERFDNVDVGWEGNGSYRSSVALTGIRLKFASGNIASGVARLYGFKK